MVNKMNTLIPTKHDSKSSGFLNQCEQWLDTGRFYVKKQIIPVTADRLTEFQRIVGTTSAQAIKGCKTGLTQMKAAVADRLPESAAIIEMPLESRFMQQLLGLEKVSDQSLTETEANIILELEKIMASGRAGQSLPMFPSLTPKLLNAMRSDEAPWPVFREVIDNDPLMKNRLFKATGSRPSYLQLPASKDELRKLLLRVSVEMVMQFDRDEYGKSSRDRAFTQSQKTAIAAISLAKEGYGDTMEAWLAGLTHNVAQIILIRQLRHFQLDTTESVSLAFLNELHTMVSLLSHRVATAWKLPVSVGTAIKEQGTLGLNSKLSELGEGLYLATRIAMIHSMEACGESQEFPESLISFSGMDRLAICESAYSCINDYFTNSPSNTKA